MSQAGQIIMGLALVAACTGAGAQTVYRCGNAYSQAPCTGGQVIDTSETLQTRQPGSGPSAAQRDARAAQALEKERLHLEARAAPAFIPPPREGTASGRKAAGKLNKPDQFTAVVPAKPGEKHKPKKKKKTSAKG